MRIAVRGTFSSMKSLVTIDEFTCDGCGKVVWQDTQVDGLPDGYHGNVLRVGPQGGDGGEWFACSKKCVTRAVENAGQDPERQS